MINLHYSDKEIRGYQRYDACRFSRAFVISPTNGQFLLSLNSNDINFYKGIYIIYNYFNLDVLNFLLIYYTAA